MVDLSTMNRTKISVFKSIFIVVAALTTLFVLFSTNAEAVHKGAGALVCGQCHTMHNSQGMTGTVEGFANNLGGVTPAGSIVLLRGAVDGRNEVHNLCLQCHAENGSQANVAMQPHGNRPPKVYRTSAAALTDPVDYTTMGSGGDFSFTGTFDGSTWTTLTGSDGGAIATCDNTTNPSLGRGHSLGCSDVTPPGANEGSISSLSCTNCHDPHGTDDVTNSGPINIYRNLKKQPTGGGGGSTLDVDGAATVTVKAYVGGASAQWTTLNFTGVSPGAADHIWPVTMTGAAADSNTFYEGAGGGDINNGISAWCAQCHDLWHESGTATNGPILGGAGQQDWRRHPVNESFKSARPQSGGAVEKTDSTWYLAQPIVNRHNLAKAGNTIAGGDVNYGVAADMVSGGAKVFCLSCHWVHGGPWFDNLRWDYSLTVANGAQTGNSIASTVGCQICHNR